MADTFDQRERLQGFAQPHLVGEYTTQFISIEMPEPGHSNALVGTQDRIELCSNGCRLEGSHLLESLTARLPGLRRLPTFTHLVHQFLDIDQFRCGQSLSKRRRKRTVDLSAHRFLHSMQALHRIAVEQGDATIRLLHIIFS